VITWGVPLLPARGMVARCNGFIHVEVGRVFGRPGGPQDRTQTAKLEIPFGHAFDKRWVSLPRALCACTLSVCGQPSRPRIRAERPFAIRVWLAAIVAWYVSFWLSLDAPSTALVTVAIVAEPTRGPGPGEGSLARTTNMFSASQYAAKAQVAHAELSLPYARSRSGRLKPLADPRRRCWL
jgi:hypothetical protein